MLSSSKWYVCISGDGKQFTISQYQVTFLMFRYGLRSVGIRILQHSLLTAQRTCID